MEVIFYKTRNGRLRERSPAWRVYGLRFTVGTEWV
jgi:hypothetical protein